MDLYTVIKNKSKTVFMKKSKYVDYAVILAALSNRKKRRMEKANIILAHPVKNVSISAKQQPTNVAA
jgi:hypothetical protein